MSDRDLLALYSARLLALAADIPHAGRLSDPDGTARRRSPLCGSTVTVDVAVRDGRIAAFAQDVRACALGQASAALLGAVAPGLSAAEVRAGRDALSAMLRDRAGAPAAPFGDLEVLAAAREHPNRHASILLAWEATLEALAMAEEKDRRAPRGAAAAE